MNWKARISSALLAVALAACEGPPPEPSVMLRIAVFQLIANGPDAAPRVCA